MSEKGMLLSAETFKRFCGLVYEKSGINLGPQKEALVSARMGKRIRVLGLSSYEEYYRLVKEDTTGDELVQMLDAISTNVTHFFREEAHFGFLAERLHEWKKEGQNTFKIWCAAASTGEEPYSIAMTVRGIVSDPRQCRILATDISTRVLHVAKVGRYEERHLEKVPKEYVRRFFSKSEVSTDARSYEVSSDLKKMVTYARLNLATPPFPMRGPFDAVFCRNVMIYFDNKVRKGLLDEIGRLLRPGGYLFVGHAESLSGLLSDFKSVRPSIYIK